MPAYSYPGNSDAVYPGVVATAFSTASLALTNTGQVVPGCTYTVSVAGTYLVIINVDFNYAVGDTSLVGLLTVDTVAASAQAVYAPATNVASRSAVSQSYMVYLQVGQVLNVRAFKFGTGGTSSTNTGHTGMTIMQPGTGALPNLAQVGEVALYSGPSSILTVTNATDTTSVAVTWPSIIGHRYRLTARTQADIGPSGTQGTLDIHFDVPGQALNYVAWVPAPTANQFIYGNSVAEFTETATQTRSVPLSIGKLGTGSSIALRANNTMMAVEDITPGGAITSLTTAALQTLPVAGGWTGTVTNNLPAQYWRDSNGIVHVTGVIAPTSAITVSGQTVATLPLGYRPSGVCFFDAPTNNAGNVVHLDMTATGNINIVRASNTAIASGQTIGLNLSFPGQ